MKTYRLVFPKDRTWEARTVEFDAHDAGAALSIARREATDRCAELWCEDERLCTIRRNPADFWQVERPPAAPE